jgi:hypothetical protein
MASISELVPMRWLCGPLDIAQRQDQEGFTAQAKETLERWQDPVCLEILRGTPVNCVVLNWAAGLPADKEQPQALAPLISRSKAAGLAVVAIIDGKADRAAALASARAAGLDAVLFSGDAPAAGLPVIPLEARPHLTWGAASPVLAARGNVWPAVAGMGLASQAWRSGQDETAAGPTADPWIDSNGWFLRLARACGPSKRVWLLFDPPPKAGLLQPADYERAVADTYAWGGRWVLTLDEPLRAALGHNEQSALDRWRAIAATVSFFESRRRWRDYSPLGVIGVISDFFGANELVGTETLNLVARRNLPYRIIEKSKALATPFTGLKALVVVDQGLPEPALRKKLLSFAEQGGALLTSIGWKGEGGKPAGSPHPRLELRTLGKGRFAVCTSESPDPYMVARDIHVLLGRAHDLVRFFNLSAFLMEYASAPDGSSALLQVINYAGRGSGDVATAWFQDQFQSARLWETGAAVPRPLSMYPENTGMDVELPAITTYVGVEVSKGKLT